MKTSSRPADRYIRCDDFAARIDGVELEPEVWAVFAQLSQARNAVELAERLKLDVEAVNAAFRRLVRRKLIRKHVLAWRDYAASAAIPTEAAPATPAPAPVAPSSPPASRSAPPFYVQQTPPAPSSQLPPPRSSGVSFRVGPATPPPRRSPVVSLRIESVRTVTAPASLNLNPSPLSGGGGASAAPGLRLRPVLDAIGAKAGGGIAGQLLVYRVFLQIPTELMHAAGIHSLSLVDDEFTLSHPELRAALADTARRHAGIDIEALPAAV